MCHPCCSVSAQEEEESQMSSIICDFKLAFLWLKVPLCLSTVSQSCWCECSVVIWSCSVEVSAFGIWKDFHRIEKNPKTITEFGEKAEQYINMHTRNRVNVRNHAETRNMRMCLAAFHSESLEKGVCVIEWVLSFWSAEETCWKQ